MYNLNHWFVTRHISKVENANACCPPDWAHKKLFFNSILWNKKKWNKNTKKKKILTKAVKIKHMPCE